MPNQREMHDLRGWLEKASKDIDTVLASPGLDISRGIIDLTHHLRKRLEALEAVVKKEDIVAAFQFYMNEPTDERDIKHELLDKKGILLHWSEHLAIDLQSQGVDSSEADLLKRAAWKQEMDEVAAVTGEEHINLNYLTRAEQTRRQLTQLLGDVGFMAHEAVQVEVKRISAWQLSEDVLRIDDHRDHLELVSPLEFTHLASDDEEAPKKKQR